MSNNPFNQAFEKLGECVSPQMSVGVHRCIFKSIDLVKVKDWSSTDRNAKIDAFAITVIDPNSLEEHTENIGVNKATFWRLQAIIEKLFPAMTRKDVTLAWMGANFAAIMDTVFEASFTEEGEKKYLRMTVLGNVGNGADAIREKLVGSSDGAIGISNGAQEQYDSPF